MHTGVPHLHIPEGGRPWSAMGRTRSENGSPNLLGLCKQPNKQAATSNGPHFLKSQRPPGRLQSPPAGVRQATLPQNMPKNVVFGPTARADREHTQGASGSFIKSAV